MLTGLAAGVVLINTEFVYSYLFNAFLFLILFLSQTKKFHLYL